MERTWETLHVGEETDLRIFKVRVDEVRNPKTGETLQITKLTGNDSVNVLAITKKGTAMLIDQYRFGIEGYAIELPGGIVDDGEDHLQAAKRELMEETGYSAAEWHYAGCVASNPVFMDSYIHHYLAIGAELTGQSTHEAGEDIELREEPLEQVRKMLADGNFVHPHTVSGVLRGLRALEMRNEEK